MNEEIMRINESHGVGDNDALGDDDLCVLREVDIPERYKVLKFEIFNDTGNLMAHIRRYCDQMIGIGRNEAILMCLFSRSLSGKSLDQFMSQDLRRQSGWKALAKIFLNRFAFNVEIVPDRYSLDRIKQKNDKSFRDYAFYWRKEADKLQPLRFEEEMVFVFSHAQEGEFYARMVSAVRATFADLVKIGELLEKGIRTGKIVKTPTLSGSSMFPKKKERM